MIVRTLTTLLLTLGLAATALAQDCTDERATDVPGHEEESKKTKRCGFGFQLFGYDLDLLGKRCPHWVKIFPDHQKCQGEELVGHRCVYAEQLEVVRLECDCADATIIFDTGIALPNCDCDYGGSAGTIEDFETEECEPE